MLAALRRMRWESAAAYGIVAAAAALAYLPLVGQLGFYNDDWFTLISRISNVGLLRMHVIDRPVMGLVYTITYRLLGDAPLAWHLFSFVVRAMGGLAFLWLLRLVWPEQRRMTLTAACLFIIYPGFLQQPGANNFSNHFISFFLGLTSLALGVKALKCKPGSLRVSLIIISAGMVLVYPLIYEAMIGLEGMRLILYWVVLQPAQKEGLKRRLRRVVTQAWPFLAALAGVVGWRLFIFQGGRSNTDAGGLLRQYLNDPLGMALKVLVETGRDFVETVVLAWGVPANKLAARAGALEILIPLGLAALLGLGLWLYTRRVSSVEVNPISGKPSTAAWVGVLGVLVTLLPVILTDRSVDYSYSMDRFTLQSSAAAALLLSAALFSGGQRWVRWGGLGVLIVLAMVTHFNNAVYYRDHWQNQKQVWFQMTARAPLIKADTLLMVLLPAGYRQAEGFAVFGPANAIYYPKPGPIQLTAEVLNADTVPWVLKGESMYRAWRNVEYTRNFKNVLVASMPSASSCLHVLDGDNLALSSREDPLIWQVAGASRIEQISTEGETKTPPAIIFGPIPRVDWCTYYQQASLARQKGDWKQVASLGDEAAQKGFQPKDVSEWVPFIEGYARVGRMDDARRLAELAKKDAMLVHSVCVLSHSASLVTGLMCGQ